MGGRRHGGTATVAPGTQSWVDLLTADTYLRRPFPYVQADPENPRSHLNRRGFWLEAFVHQSIAGDPVAARSWFSSLALARLYEQAGVEVPVADIQAWMARQQGSAGGSQNGRAQ